jgi:hypothetical protein
LKLFWLNATVGFLNWWNTINFFAFIFRVCILIFALKITILHNFLILQETLIFILEKFSLLRRSIAKHGFNLRSVLKIDRIRIRIMQSNLSSKFELLVMRLGKAILSILVASEFCIIVIGDWLRHVLVLGEA